MFINFLKLHESLRSFRKMKNKKTNNLNTWKVFFGLHFLYNTYWNLNSFYDFRFFYKKQTTFTKKYHYDLLLAQKTNKNTYSPIKKLKKYLQKIVTELF